MLNENIFIARTMKKEYLFIDVKHYEKKNARCNLA